jgi:hypothetical protein
MLLVPRLAVDALLELGDGEVEWPPIPLPEYERKRSLE